MGAFWCNLEVKLTCFNGNFQAYFGLPYNTTYFGDTQWVTDWLQPGYGPGALNPLCCRFSDAFVGMVTMGKNMSVQALIQIISKAFSEGSHVRSCELMTHPGYRCPPTEGGCGDGPDDFAQSEDREHEMRVLDHHSLKQFYEQNHITKVAYIS